MHHAGVQQPQPERREATHRCREQLDIMRPEAQQLPHRAHRARDRLLRVEGLQLREALGAVDHRLDDDLGLHSQRQETLADWLTASSSS